MIVVKKVNKLLILIKANNKYMECYDSSKESKCITFLDGNNLYGWAMCQYSLYSGFKWLNRK